MPTQRPQEQLHDAAYPITGSEVQAMFAASIKRPPFPSEDINEPIAQYLSNYTRAGMQRQVEEAFPGATTDVRDMGDADVRTLMRWQIAARTLRSVANDLGSFPTQARQAYAELLRELDKVEVLLAAEPIRKAAHKEWAGPAIGITFTLAEVLKQECGGNKGTSRDSVAVKFAAHALKRIGWRDAFGRPVTTGAISGWCAKARREDATP